MKTLRDLIYINKKAGIICGYDLANLIHSQVTQAVYEAFGEDAFLFDHNQLMKKI